MSSTCTRRSTGVSLVDEIARRDPGARVLVQVDTTGEPGKGGCPVARGRRRWSPPRVDAGLDVARADDRRPDRGWSRGGARTASERSARSTTQLGLGVCSMGMTDDLEVAVEEGSTQVRVGTALFGWRDREVTL